MKLRLALFGGGALALFGLVINDATLTLIGTALAFAAAVDAVNASGATTR